MRLQSLTDHVSIYKSGELTRCEDIPLKYDWNLLLHRWYDVTHVLAAVGSEAEGNQRARLPCVRGGWDAGARRLPSAQGDALHPAQSVTDVVTTVSAGRAGLCRSPPAG